ncbi:MAG: hypothetical protein JWN40_4793 [Phycisphaerales bacterium]|nr:hypothetical protein [Phycisphaerales bacterium]
MAVPTLDAPLAEYSTNFQALGSAAPGEFSLSVGQMAQYTVLHDNWMAAYNAAKPEGSRSRALVRAKNDMKALLLSYLRELYGVIKTSQSVTNENKTLIGVTIVDRNTSSPIRPPAQAPLVTLISVIGRVAHYRLADATAPSNRRKPINAEGAMIRSFAGATPPATDGFGWRVEGQTGRTTFTVTYPNSVAPGTPCWVTVVWYNRRGEYSPACAPVQAYLQAGPVAQAA